MKLLHIKASDFMRYRKIELTNLPESGLFTIRGENESGKSTIGHLIYFALSGKSFYGGHTQELIRWEGSQLKAEFHFSHNEKTYQIDRQVDRDGSNFSKLICGDNVLAQGNPEVREKLQDILAYNPDSLQQSCLITHNVIQNLLSNNPTAHLKFMVGIDSIEKLAQDSDRSIEQLVQSLRQMVEEQQQKESDRNGVGYSEEEEIEHEQKHETLLEKEKKLKVDLEEKEDSLKEVQNQLQTIESESKILPSKYEEENMLRLHSELPQSIEKLKDIPLSGKPKELMASSLKLMDKILHYQKSTEILSDKFEHHLNQYRNTLGINQDNQAEENKNSFANQEKKLNLKKNVTGTFHKLSKTAGLLSLFFCITLVILYINRQPVLSQIRGFSFITSLHDTAIHELWLMLKNVFRPGEYGFPSNPKAYMAMGIVGGISLISIVCWIKSSIKFSNIKTSLLDLEKEKKKVQDEYHALLAADFKEMNEVSALIERSHIMDLKDAFSTFNQKNELYVENQYKSEVIIQKTKRSFEEVVQAMNVRAHQIQLEMQEIEETIAAEKTKLNELLPILETIKEKKERHLALSQTIEELKQKSEQEKSELSVQEYLKELASSCETSMLSKLRVTMTNLYKQILPLVTEGRYASIHLDDDFNMSVFSEERNHFVPLHNLSSGTNDLFVLIFQIILVHGFMESRRIDQHFVFLDEPLLAVDGHRYQKLSEMLPRFSDKLNQIFLCRPPEKSQTYTHVIETSLNNQELVVDFSMAHIS